ncbi:MAG: hypothetical protein K6F28_04500 [Lachnospiraceae bacterium]|nr:hypothetical protein [Lachnospiraceae bacterium]
MFNIMTSMDYVLPPPQVSGQIPTVASVAPNRKPGRNRDRKKGDTGGKKKPVFKELMEKEVKEEFGQMGCFFETTA